MLTNLKKLIKRILIRLCGPILHDALAGDFSTLRENIVALRRDLSATQSLCRDDFSILRQEISSLRDLCRDISGRFLLTEAGRQENDLRYQDILLLLNRLTPFVSEKPFSVQTDYPVAYESNDHKFPRGTKNDNTRLPRFVAACEKHFPGQSLCYMDLGCSGGGLVLDFLLRGYAAVGIEGSDFSQKSQRAEWRLLNQRNLFTADITKPFQVYSQGIPFLSHIISAWEVMEHIHEEDLPQLFKNVYKHLLPGGFFVGSIAAFDDVGDDISFHPTVKPRYWWEKKFSEYELPFSEEHSFEFYDFARGTGNGFFDWNCLTDPSMGFHFVTRKLPN
jgi:SAM-dependent methyltransferase